MEKNTENLINIQDTVEQWFRIVQQVNEIAHYLQDNKEYQEIAKNSTSEALKKVNKGFSKLLLRSFRIDLDFTKWFVLKDFIVDYILWAYRDKIKLVYKYKNKEPKSYKKTEIFQSAEDIRERYYDILELKYKQYRVHCMPWMHSWEKADFIVPRDYWKNEVYGYKNKKTALTEFFKELETLLEKLAALLPN